MTSTFVALLRGVNVGKSRRVPMAGFRTLLASLGYQDVATPLNSGNAVFRSTGGTPASHAARIARGLAEQMKVAAPVIVVSAAELAKAVSDCPIPVDAAEHSRLLAAFAQDRATPRSLAGVASLVEPPEQFAVGRHCAYLFCSDGILASRAADALLGKAGAKVTTRNWATVLKLHALAGAA
jgi:uncharacterized protein (DUF1697 family)